MTERRGQQSGDLRHFTDRERSYHLNIVDRFKGLLAPINPSNYPNRLVGGEISYESSAAPKIVTDSDREKIDWSIIRYQPRANLACIYNRYVWFEDVEEYHVEGIPDFYSEPTYYFAIYRIGNELEERATSPYGVLPHLVWSADNKLCFVTNSYYFDEAGLASKYERILRFDEGQTNLEIVAEDAGVNLSEMEKLDFVVRPEDSRSVRMEHGDYETIESGLYFIQQGLLVEKSRHVHQ